jgi:hypothetical protein
VLLAVGQGTLVATRGPAAGDRPEHGFDAGKVQLGFVLSGEGGELAVLV